jgi:hypothetical protein
MKSPVKGAKKKPGLDDIELHADAWDRFEDFVKTKVPTKAAVPAKSKAPKAKAGKSK